MTFGRNLKEAWVSSSALDYKKEGLLIYLASGSFLK